MKLNIVTDQPRLRNRKKRSCPNISRLYLALEYRKRHNIPLDERRNSPSARVEPFPTSCVEVLCSVHLCAVLDMRVLASLVREQTVREQTACLHSGNAAALVVRIDKDFTTAIAESLDM
jgi:hypothetical protein